MPKLFKYVLITAVTVVGIVAVASTIAADAAEGFSTMQTDGRTDVAVFASERDAGVVTGAVPDAALFRAHREFSHPVSDCVAPGEEDFKSRSEKILARVALN
jgi:hypothetical protein